MDPREVAYLSALFDLLPTGVMIADDAGNYVRVNPAAYEALGWPRGSLIGKDVGTLVPRTQRHVVESQWKAFLRDGRQSGVFTMQTAGGEPRDVYFDAIAHFAPGLHISFVTRKPRPTTPRKDDDILTMCAWSKRILHQGRWLTIEEYLRDVHGLTVSHGLAPDALEDIGEV